MPKTSKASYTSELKTPFKLLIAAGGTGGHVMPALAIAELLIKKNNLVSWVGTENSFEQKQLLKYNIPFFKINIKGLRKTTVKNYLTAPFIITRAILQSLKIILRYQPDVVLVMGGYVSGPVGIAAWLLAKRLVIHEQNAIAGTANKLLKIFADDLITHFPTVFNHHKNRMIIGNPVRESIENIAPPEIRLITPERKALRILILGGSQGSLMINHLIPVTIAHLNLDHRPLIWHQTGEKSYLEIIELYQRWKIPAKICPFIDHIEEAYQWADLVICRAGAMTITELTTVGIASILIPFSKAVDNHQWHNANYLARENAAIILLEHDLTPEKLAQTIRSLYDPQRELLIKMATAARNLRKLDAAEAIIHHLINKNNNKK